MVVLLAGALLVMLVMLPCVLVLAVSSTEATVRRRAGLRSTIDTRRLNRKIHQPPCLQSIAAARHRMPAIEQIAAELRRLDRQRKGGPTSESERWSAAVREAYDNWLLFACRSLAVPERLTTLDGTDRDIERVRVEGALEAAGLVLR